MNELTTPVALQTIQAVLTPALLISACGLLLLGLNNRYAIVVNRVRLLNDEKRRKLVAPETIDREYVDAVRFESLMRQIPSLLIRANHLRHALMHLWIGVICYLVTSLSLGASLFLYGGLATLAVAIFMAGIIFAVIGVVYALMDISLAQKVLHLESELY
ncbi:MAG: DUF2721 domain-containing protein [Ignavibacteria bacterium]|nr:DUF2721 domain-containing protein [Ignavibacteria bacterium]